MQEQTTFLQGVPQMPSIPQGVFTSPAPASSPVPASTSSRSVNTAPPQQGLRPGQAMIGPVKWDYVHVFEAKTYDNGDSKYTVTLIIDKSDKVNLQSIMDVAKAAYEVRCNQVWQCQPLQEEFTNMMLNLLHNGDTDMKLKDNPLYQNSYFIRASRKEKLGAPTVLDVNNNPLPSSTQIYSGAVGDALLTFRAYNVNGNRGLTCYLEALRMLQNGSGYSSSKSNANSNIINTFRNFNSGGITQ